MTYSLLMTKVSPPILRQNLVPRERVVKLLREGIQNGHLLTLVSAPAGYGKTTTIRMWVEEAGLPFAWVTLENSDNDLKQFLIYILTALQLVEDDLGRAALEVVENAQEINLQSILGILINDLHELIQPIILVLEDYHQIENEKIDLVIETLLNQTIQNLHLVISTREDPNLPLTRLRVRNQLKEIRAMDLSFSVNETDQFFSNVMSVNLSKTELEILKNRTEGWVAGLQLAALSLKESRDPTKFVEAFRGTHRHVLDYLIDEVLKGQSEEVQEFLHRTSILDQLSPSLCEAVSGQKSSRKTLHYLENNNLFLIPLDEERTWYRYHALFAELLKNQLLQAEPEHVEELHERAANWYQKNGFIQKAVDHAFQISDIGNVSKLIERHAMQLLYQGQVSTVVGWFDRLPDSLIQSSPMLCISKAWSLALLHRQKRTAEIHQALRATETALELAHADESLRNLIAGYTASIQAFLMKSPEFSSEKPEKLIEVAQKALQLLPEDQKATRSVNYLNLGDGYAALADLPSAEKSFNQAVEDGVAGGNFYAAIYGPINMILIAINKGQLEYAMQLCQENIDRFNQELAGQNFPPIGALHILKGCLLLEENRQAEAEQALTQGLSLVQWTGEYRTHWKGFSTLARLGFAQGDPMGISESIKNLEQSLPGNTLFAQALRHRLSLRNPVPSRSALEQASLWAAQQAVDFGILPDITGVDPMSEISFRTYLSTAHVQTRLASHHDQANSLRDIHDFFARQERFAETHSLFGWLIEIWILRALMYHVDERTADARNMIEKALNASLPRGYFRLFLDEGDLLLPLLQSVRHSLKNEALSTFVKRLLEAMPGEALKNKTDLVNKEKLSDRELEVLQLLAAGLTYEEIGRELCLSLNTVQFHVKNIYGKLLVNRRVQAIQKARDMDLIRA